jgi:N-acetylglucosamine malate deacetylase 1
MGSLRPNLLDGISEKRILVYAPHADDEVLGAGGLLALAGQRGWETHVHFATVSGYFSENKAEFSHSRTRVEEVQAALAVLKCAGWEVLFEGEDKHLRLDIVPQSDLINFVDQGLKRIRPSIVISPCRGHYHQDHIAFANAVVSAMRPAPDGNRPLVPLVLSYGHAHGGWGGEHYLFRPSVFIDISPVIDVKLEALACYSTQLCDEPHARSLPMVREQAGAWGAYAGVRYAEAFECLRLLLA